MKSRRFRAASAVMLLVGGSAVAGFGLTSGLLGFGRGASGDRLARMQRSPHWTEGHFENTDPVKNPMKPGASWSGLVREYAFGDAQRTPPATLPVVDPVPKWTERPSTGLRATWLGHSSVLVELDGHRVLTDPVWGERASPSPYIGPRRFQPAPVPLSALPPVDAVVISHDHYDHLDLPTIQALVPGKARFFVPLGVGAHLEAWGVQPERIVELDWWETAELPGTALRFTATPARHFSGRIPGDRNPTLWASWVVATEHHRVFFSGDTGLTPEFLAIRERFGPFNLVMLEVGAWNPAWGDIHLGPSNALAAHEMLGGGPLLPIHWGTFNLALHAWDEPLETLTRLAAPGRVTLLTPRLGMPVEPLAPPPVDPWWREVGTAVQAPSPAPATAQGQP
ncbi:MAG: hypothetical protein RL653_1484 [Pseudomonadota bacterium]|jgi:L-ascorbate metabolism protein UlaG (beta-lactamase superfamily)